jgi:hypothetical protein
MSTATYPTLLQERITAYFNRAELADLCLRLGLNFDSLPDAGLAAQARELILLLARQERLPELLAALRVARPHFDWPPVPPDYRPPAAAPAPAATGGIHINTVKADSLLVGDGGQMTVTYGPRYELSGDFRGALLNIESTLRDVRQTIESLPAADDARAELIRLVGQLGKALQATPPGRETEAEEVADLAKELMEAAGAEKPSRAKVRGLGAGLKEAAGALADALPSIVDVAARIAVAVSALSG